METIFYMILGIITTVLVTYIYQKHKQHPISARGWVFFLSGMILFLFGVAWAQVSIHEREIQAAVMGIVFFSGIGIILSFLSWREIVPEKKGKGNKSESLIAKPVNAESIAASSLLFLCAVLLPVSMLMYYAGGIVFNPDRMTDLVVDNIVSDDALTRTIKKAVVYQIQYGSDESVLDERVITGILGSVDEEEWIEFFNLVAPLQSRIALVREGVQAVHNWLDNKHDYPELEIRPGIFIDNLVNSAENVIQWIFRATLFPPYEEDSVFPHCKDDKLQGYENGIFSDDLKELIGCRPPEEYRDIIAPKAAVLLKSQVVSADIPKSIQLKEKIAGSMTSAQMQSQKQQAQILRNVTRFLWILPVVFIISGLVLSRKSTGSYASTVCWPLALSGLFGLIISVLLKGNDTLIKIIIPNLVETVPAPALGIIQNLLTGLFSQVGHSLSITASVLLASGFILGVAGYRKRLF